jgi:hypothetical protein
VSCYVYKFPEDELSQTAKLKYHELKVKAYLTQQFPDVFTHNARVWFGECTDPYRRFIDFYVLIGNTLFIIEVDEKQHRGYDEKDEELRMTQILHNIGLEKKIVAIRFNPDSYKIDGKATRTSYEQRLITLKQKTTEIIEKLEAGFDYDAPYTEIKLFYDQ